MDEQKMDEQKTQGAEAATYEPPVVVDYGDIFEITAANLQVNFDGVGPAHPVSGP